MHVGALRDDALEVVDCSELLSGIEDETWLAEDWDSVLEDSVADDETSVSELIDALLVSTECVELDVGGGGALEAWEAELCTEDESEADDALEGRDDGAEDVADEGLDSSEAVELLKADDADEGEDVPPDELGREEVDVVDEPVELEEVAGHGLHCSPEQHAW